MYPSRTQRLQWGKSRSHLTLRSRHGSHLASKMGERRRSWPEAHFQIDLREAHGAWIVHHCKQRNVLARQRHVLRVLSDQAEQFGLDMALKDPVSLIWKSSSFTVQNPGRFRAPTDPLPALPGSERYACSRWLSSRIAKRFFNEMGGFHMFGQGCDPDL